MTIGNLVAIAQRNIKRMFGYSTIAHAGYILVGVAAVATADNGSETFGPSSVLFYLAAYAAANLTAFFAIVCIGNRINSDEIEDYAGMLRRAPFLAVALALALIALIGVPPTSIFIAKIYIFAAAINTGESLMTWLVIIGVVNSVVSAYYYLRVIKVMFLQPAIYTERLGASWPVNVALGVAALSMLWLGVCTSNDIGSRGAGSRRAPVGRLVTRAGRATMKTVGIAYNDLIPEALDLAHAIVGEVEPRREQLDPEGRRRRRPEPASR